jgi:hypothetical protein
MLLRLFPDVRWPHGGPWCVALFTDRTVTGAIRVVETKHSLGPRPKRDEQILDGGGPVPTSSIG